MRQWSTIGDALTSQASVSCGKGVMFLTQHAASPISSLFCRWMSHFNYESVVVSSRRGFLGQGHHL